MESDQDVKGKPGEPFLEPFIRVALSADAPWEPMPDFFDAEAAVIQDLKRTRRPRVPDLPAQIRARWDEVRAELDAELDATLAERAERMVAADNPLAALWSASLRDACTALALRSWEHLVMDGEELPKPTTEEVVEAFQEALDRNTRYFEAAQKASTE